MNPDTPAAKPASSPEPQRSGQPNPSTSQPSPSGQPGAYRPNINNRPRGNFRPRSPRPMGSSTNPNTATDATGGQNAGRVVQGDRITSMATAGPNGILPAGGQVNGGRPNQGQGQGQNNRGGQGQGQNGRPRQGGGSNQTARGTRHSGPPRRPQAPTTPQIPINKSPFNGTGGEQQTQIKERKANAVTRENKLRIIPLGGLGEVGKNMMAIEYGNDIVVVDMGFAFPDELQPGIDYIIPDITYLEKNKHKIRGIVITHGHMDHIGAAGYVLPKINVPIFGTRLSLGMVAKQIEEFKLQTQPQWRVMDPDKHEKVQLGVFSIELIRVTHSIPDATAVAISTPIGMLIHTGDWRLDPTPTDGRMMDMPRLTELGKQGVLMLMSDSTNCERMGRTLSEVVLEQTFAELFQIAGGRVIVSTFASSITRVQLIIDAAHAANRKLALNGRSMLSNIELAVKLGYLKVPQGLIVKVQDSTRLKDNEVVVLCTGSQGEPNAALSRMSTGDHPQIKIKAGDSIIFSSNPIPGNENSVTTIVDSLMREGAKVYQNVTREIDEHGLLHVSGHASRDDIIDLMNAVKPKYFMPIHGEYHMLVRHAELAVKNGLPQANAFVMDNGDVLEITETSAKRGERVPSGIVLIDGAGVGDVEQVVLRDRLTMSGDGIFVIVATVDRKTGKLLTSPDIISRGFIYMKDNEELISRARAEIRKSFEKRGTGELIDWSRFKLKLRDDVSDLLYKRTKRNPMIIPVINEV